MAGLTLSKNSAYSVTVALDESGTTVSGSSTLSAASLATITINVLNVNEPPQIVSAPSSWHVAEHSSWGAVLMPAPVSAVLRVFDQEDIYSSSLTVTVGNQYFETVPLDSNGSYALRFRENAPDIDYDQGVTLVVVVLTLTDSDGLTSNMTSSVLIDDINQGV